MICALKITSLKIKTMKYLLLASCLTILLATSCKKNKPSKPLTELEKLPPITQTGANTFGCLLNGKAWIPKDNYGQASFQLDVDPTYGEGKFSLSATRYEGDGNGFFFAFSFGSISCKQVGMYNFNRPDIGFSVFDSKLLCLYNNNTEGVYKKGVFSILKYDLANRIFSGTFEFILYKEGCGDTLNFTNGRFDKKL